MRQWSRLVLSCAVLFGCFAAVGADLKEAQQQYRSGHYSRSLTLAKQALRTAPEDENWELLLSKALLATGQYPEALSSITNALAHLPGSVRLRWQAREVFRSVGRTNLASQMAADIVRLVSRNPRHYRDASSRVAFGRAALALGADPKRVLDNLFDPAIQAQPDLREAYLACGELALDKHDFALAAKRFQEGLKHLPDDPGLHCGLAQAYAPSDPALMVASIEAALSVNSNHVGSLLLLVDHSIDAEAYDQAARLLDRIQKINPWKPDAWAYRAVLANLQNQPQAAQKARDNGLKYWCTNPRVDYLIGRKLSQKYRFAEGAEHQRRALRFDPDYLPAKIQLAQDLLRLGDEAQGWKLAQEVQQEDGYDVEAYNLSTLHDTMKKFVTLMNANFRVRMSRHEATLYGPQVLDLLDEAKSNLCAKYGLALKQPITVEIFPEQKDFSVRTFGLPGDPGYLAVCFGSVITANSPASQTANPSNWKDVLWHEFCHVVTLHLTRNKMPRWLSEGISVYEERQANPAWGEHMNPDYREMVLGGDLTPISKLSAAFLTPRSALHLQFAYYESSLVVEFMVQRYGLDQLKAILHDLGEGQEINQTIAKHTEPIAKLETDFAAFARNKAENLAPGLDWSKPDAQALGLKGHSVQQGRSPLDLEWSPFSGTNNATHGSTTLSLADRDSWDAWAKSHPTNFWVLTRKAETLAQKKQWAEVKSVSQELIRLYPGDTGANSPYRLLAAAHRALGETNAERRILADYAERDPEAPDAYLRLMQLDAAVKDWPAVRQNAERYLAVNPLVAPPYRYLAEASEHLDQTGSAIEAYQALLALDPADPADVHYRLADALYRDGVPEAKRQVLEALEDAPGYRAALHLLLKIDGQLPQSATNSPNLDPPRFMGRQSFHSVRPTDSTLTKP